MTRDRLTLLFPLTAEEKEFALSFEGRDGSERSIRFRATSIEEADHLIADLAKAIQSWGSP